MEGNINKTKHKRINLKKERKVKDQLIKQNNFRLSRKYNNWGCQNGAACKQ